MFDVQAGYLRTVQERGYRLPDRYLEFMPQVERIRAALAVAPVPTVPCNNDLLAANFIDDGERVWIIDFEYSGNNDPCFELGNVWSESTLDLDRCSTSCVAALLRRERPEWSPAHGCSGSMSKYGWMLWASIQDANSDLDFDFWEWGMEKYGRAVAGVRRARFRTPDAAAASKHADTRGDRPGGHRLR